MGALKRRVRKVVYTIGDGNMGLWYFDSDGDVDFLKILFDRSIAIA